jgi:hypothetical protein
MDMGLMRSAQGGAQAKFEGSALLKPFQNKAFH